MWHFKHALKHTTLAIVAMGMALPVPLPTAHTAHWRRANLATLASRGGGLLEPFKIFRARKIEGESGSRDEQYLIANREDALL